MNSKYSVVDNNGLSFINLGTMLEYYKVTPVDYLVKSDEGVSLSDILSKPSEFYTYRLYRDAFGSYFKDLDTMCSIYEVDKYEYLKRIAMGWCVGAALSKTGGKTPRTEYVPFTEEEAEDYRDRCRLAKKSSDRLKSCISVHYIEKRCNEIRYKDRKIMKSRKLDGLTIIDNGNLVTRKVNCNGRACVDFNGKEFVSVAAMCRYYKIDPDVFYRRKEKGFSLKDCLTADKYSLRKKEDFTDVCYTDHNGDKYETLEAMCTHWGITEELYKFRIKKGYSVMEALCYNSATTAPFVDFMGNKFKNVDEICEYHDVNCNLFIENYNNGVDIKTCLASSRFLYQVGTLRVRCTDHLGNAYSSYKDMCAAYGVAPKIFNNRKRAGWNVRDCLLGKDRQREWNGRCQDHLGNWYDSLKDMCEAYNISVATFKDRMKDGWDLQGCLTGVNAKGGSRKCQDHLGNEYPSYVKMCEHWGIRYGLFMGRIQNGWSIKDALTREVEISTSQSKKEVSHKATVRDPEGNEFETLVDMCKYHNVKYSTFVNRKKKGRSLEDCLKATIEQAKKCEDHLGNKYDSINDLCRAWGITSIMYRERLKRGYSLKDTLELVKLSRHIALPVVDLNGIKYDSCIELCKANSLSIAELRSLMQGGISAEEALKTLLEH